MKKRGFTLVELLAVIAILSVILIISVPKIINQISDKKEETYEEYKSLIIAAARNYVIDYNLSDESVIALSDLCDLGYIECPIINPLSDSNMEGYVLVNEDKEYTYSEDNLNYADLIVVLNGGNTTQTFLSFYSENSSLTLTNPTKSGYAFSGWTVSGTGSSISGSTLTIGSGDTILTANWTPYMIAITVNLNGGSTTQTFASTYQAGSTISLINPTRSNYIFSGWTINGTGSSINGSVLTMGSGTTTITANWTYLALLTVNLNGGSTTQSFSTRYLSGTNISLITPTRSGYEFNGWTSSGTGSAMLSDVLMMGTADTTLTANWSA